MVETLHPDVYIEEVAGTPTIVGVSTSTAAFVGTALKGPTLAVGLVTSYQDFVRQYGEGYAPGYNLEYAVWGFFANGGRRAFIAGIKGAGAAAASLTTNSLGGAPTSGQAVGSAVQPFDLASGQTLVVKIDGGGNQTFTFTGARAVKAGSAPTLPPGAGTTLLVTIDGFPQTVTFAGTETTAALVVAAINAQLNHGRAVLNGANVDLESDVEGTAGSVNVTGGTALAAIGQSIGSVAGTGNVPNINVVQVADAVAALSGLTGATASNDGSGHLRITSATSGTSSSVQIVNTSTATAFGFDNATHSGTAAGASDPFFTFTEKFLGADGNNVTVATQRYKVATTAIINNGATTAVLNDVTNVALGDIVTISDGTKMVVVHVYAINIGTRTISFHAISIGAPIASGASVVSASSHRAQTTIASAALSGDTVINVVSSSQMHVGTLLSIDDGTNLVFRTVTKVNGNAVTLNAALGFGFAPGTLVATQSVDITVKYNGKVDKVHRFISWEPTDQIDWIEVRLQGNSNESNYVTGLSLNPSIAVDLNNRPAPITDTFLTGGMDGATPVDGDYIGTPVVPKTGIYLFDDVNSINLIAIPGIETQAVQQQLADYSTLRADIMAVGATPLADDQALEAQDYRNNVLNRDTSYMALYYPWLIVTDRHAPSGVQNPQINVSPEGYVMGLMALTDENFNVATAPANAPLLDVQSLTHFTSDGEHDILNPIGVNVIRTFPGEGVQVMGARTLSKLTDGRQYINVRRLLLYVEQSIRAGIRSQLFKAIDPKTFRKVTRMVTGFLGGVWKAGMLYPSNNFDEAQFVVCNEDNNPPETRTQGQLFLDVGINPPLPAEFIVARIGLFDGTTSIQEIVQNR